MFAGVDADAFVGATGGVAETPESWVRKWARSIKSREDVATSRLLKGREWIGKVMSSRVKSDRVARSEVLRKGRERLVAFQRSEEEARKSRIGDWISAHVKFDREWSPTWGGVMRAMLVDEAGYSALCRSSRLCPSFSLPVKKSSGRSVRMSDPGAPTPPVPLLASFSAFLEDADDLSEEAVDPPPGLQQQQLDDLRHELDPDSDDEPNMLYDDKCGNCGSEQNPTTILPCSHCQARVCNRCRRGPSCVLCLGEQQDADDGGDDDEYGIHLVTVKGKRYSETGDQPAACCTASDLKKNKLFMDEYYAHTNAVVITPANAAELLTVPNARQWDFWELFSGTAILKYLLVNCQKKQKRINPTSIHLNTFNK